MTGRQAMSIKAIDLSWLASTACFGNGLPAMQARTPSVRSSVIVCACICPGLKGQSRLGQNVVHSRLC